MTYFVKVMLTLTVNDDVTQEQAEEEITKILTEINEDYENYAKFDQIKHVREQ